MSLDSVGRGISRASTHVTALQRADRLLARSASSTPWRSIAPEVRHNYPFLRHRRYRRIENSEKLNLSLTIVCSASLVRRLLQPKTKTTEDLLLLIVVQTSQQ
jgi:hypothetical protein